MSSEELRAKLDQPSVPEEETPEETDKPAETEEKPAVEGEEPESEDESEGKTKDEAEDQGTTVEKDPPRVPYSRFETVNERAIRAEEKLRFYEEERDREQLAKAASETPSGMPEYWVKLYGDSDASKQAYALRQQELQDERVNLRKAIREDMQKEQVESEQRTDNLVDDWSTQIDDYAAKNKRKFTDTETDALLDVMDELTPKDENGNYIVEPIQYLAQAVELHDLRLEKAQFAKKQSKQQTTRLTAAKSEGAPGSKPGNWDGNWEKKLAQMGL